MGPLEGDGFCPHEWVTACRKVARHLEGWYRWAYVQGSNRDADIEKRLMDAAGWGGAGRKEGWDVWSEQRGSLPSVWKTGSRGNLPYDSGNWHGPCDNLERWGGQGDGEEAEEGPMADSFGVWQKPTKFCKAIIFQLKNKKRTHQKKKNQNFFSFFFLFNLAYLFPL